MSREDITNGVQYALYLMAIRHPEDFEEAERFVGAMLTEDKQAFRRVNALIEAQKAVRAPVYVVEAFRGSDWYIVGVYANREDAQEMAASVHRGHVDEWVPQGAVGPEG